MAKLPPALYSLEQVAAAAGVSLTTLRRHYDVAGLLPEPAWRRGQTKITRRFTRAELQAVARVERRMTKMRGAVRTELAREDRSL